MASLEAARNHGVAKASWMLRQSKSLEISFMYSCTCFALLTGTVCMYLCASIVHSVLV